MLDERPRVLAEVALDGARAAVGTSRSPRSTTIAIEPMSSGMPTSANSKYPNAPTPASSAASDTTTFTGDAREHEQAAGVGREGERHQELGRGALRPDGHEDDHGKQRRDRAVRRDQRRQPGAGEHRQHE